MSSFSSFAELLAERPFDLEGEQRRTAAVSIDLEGVSSTHSHSSSPQTAHGSHEASMKPFKWDP